MNLNWEPLDYKQLENIQMSSLGSLTKPYINNFETKNKNNPNINTGNVLKMGTSTCPSGTQIVEGTTKVVSITPSNGTPPYTVNWKVDGVIVKSFSSVPLGNVQTFNWSFNEPPGNHIYSAEVIDNCPTEAQSDSTSCVITIEAQTPTPTPSGCQNCDITKNYCISGNCVPKNYVTYGAVGLGAIFLLSMLK